MARVAVLGLGAMGRRMAQRLERAGHDLRVWSRSGVPAELARLQSRAEKTPREAVRDAEIAIAMVRDDDASREVWLDVSQGALEGLPRDAVVVESSTVTPGWARALGERAREAGLHFLDAPVVGSRPQAEAGGLVFLVGGERDTLERVSPVLAVLGGPPLWVGPTPLGALAKLAVNTLFATQVAAIAELVGTSARHGLEPRVLMNILAALPVLSPAAGAAGAAMGADRFEPQFPISLVAKDLRYAAQSAGDGPLLVASVRALFERAEAAGLGAENITAIAKLYR